MRLCIRDQIHLDIHMNARLRGAVKQHTFYLLLYSKLKPMHCAEEYFLGTFADVYMGLKVQS
jgi:hypothetical protein